MPCGGMRSGLAGLWAVGGKFVEKDESSTPHISEMTRCPDCGWQITEEFTWCPQCGSRLKPYKCEYCRGLIIMPAEACPRCGAPFK